MRRHRARRRRGRRPTRAVEARLPRIRRRVRSGAPSGSIGAAAASAVSQLRQERARPRFVDRREERGAGRQRGTGRRGLGAPTAEPVLALGGGERARAPAARASRRSWRAAPATSRPRARRAPRAACAGWSRRARDCPSSPPPRAPRGRRTGWRRTRSPTSARARGAARCDPTPRARSRQCSSTARGAPARAASTSPFGGTFPAVIFAQRPSVRASRLPRFLPRSAL